MPDAPANPSGTPERPANRLVRETSPYLIQHAHNPVDWYPWGQEAFDAARERGVPLFLSVGYSTCYWCHVMERESFEDPSIGALMNERFVSVKVDREERPDVDDAYMAAVQAMTQSGGWPMSVFLEPRTLKPFWCGTYFPPKSAYGRPSFRQVLEGVSRAWHEQRAEVLEQADELAKAVAERIGERRPAAPAGKKEITRAVADLLKAHDRSNGGFGSAPKFPQPVYLDFLLEFRGVAGDEETRGAVDSAVRLTLDRMALGGINDQVGGGFHRYSTDAQWLVPHFEKMLYDNAQLAGVYARAADVFHDAFYARVAQRTLDYVLREMTGPDGGFYSAQDAEVDHREGRNYLWTYDQLVEVLGEEQGGFAAKVYNVPRDGGNFRDPHHPQDPASNVLALGARPAVLAARMGMGEDEFLDRLDRTNGALYHARLKRPQPARDDKVLTGWNGLMIGALAVADRSLNRKEGGVPGARTSRAPYSAAAVRAAEFLLANLQTPGRALRRSYRKMNGVPIARVDAFLEDHAFLSLGLLQLAGSGLDRDGAFLREAARLMERADGQFGDGAGGWFDTQADQTDLFIRTRSEYDGAIPAGSSVMVNNLLDLHELTGERSYLERASRAIASLSGFIAAAPVGAINSTRALLRVLLKEPSLLPWSNGGAESAPISPALSAGDVVAVFASEERVVVREREPAGLILQVRIQEGYHITAPDPGRVGAELVGFHIDIVNGSGVRAYADYPPGEPYRPAWADKDQPIPAYTGTIAVPVMLEREGPWKGRPLLAVWYQACTDTACLAPSTLELDVAIDRG